MKSFWNISAALRGGFFVLVYVSLYRNAKIKQKSLKIYLTHKQKSLLLSSYRNGRMRSQTVKTVTTIDTGVSGTLLPLNDMLLAMYELNPSTLTAQDKKNVICAVSSLLDSLSDDISGIGYEACSLLLGAKNLTTDAYLSVLPNEQEQAA